jgi:hypothetical protein
MDTEDRIKSVALMLSRPEPQRRQWVAVNEVTVADGSADDLMSDVPSGLQSMMEFHRLAKMSPAQIVEQSRKHLSASFYTEVGNMPSVAIYDKLLDCFLWSFVDTDGEVVLESERPSVALYANHFGIWARSFAEALSAERFDAELAAKCAAASSYFLAALLLGSFPCWKDLHDEEQ